MTDDCEWNPAAERMAWTTEPAHAQAAIIVGSDPNWRLCAECAALPRFARYRKRTTIQRRTP